jgi:hypothetical protein
MPGLKPGCSDYGGCCSWHAISPETWDITGRVCHIDGRGSPKNTGGQSLAIALMCAFLNGANYSPIHTIRIIGKTSFQLLRHSREIYASDCGSQRHALMRIESQRADIATSF